MVGEKHLLILSNTDHSLLTGLPKVNPRSQPHFVEICDIRVSFY